MSVLASLQPPEIWKHFREILQRPRPSNQEEAMRQYIIRVAQEQGLFYLQDQVGNCLVRKPATPGKEGSPPVILQAHMDMVCSKNPEVTHDFLKDSIAVQQVGDYLKAIGTTLGADNGIGLAAALAVLESKSLIHGPLECFFTIDEETGLNGAKGLQTGLLQGKYLINLDSEDEGVICIGCAGGKDAQLSLAVPWAPPATNEIAVSFTLHDLVGGHSGVDIHLGRASAVVLLGRILWKTLSDVPFALATISGGDKRNAIARFSSATLVLAPKDKDALLASVRQQVQEIQAEYGRLEPHLKLDFSPAELPSLVMREESTRKAIALLHALPHGVQAMNPDFPDLVETSCNLALVSIKEQNLSIEMSCRSSVASALSALVNKIAAFGQLAGARVFSQGGYPGWKPNLNSPLLALAKQAYQEATGKTALAKAIHAGLECGMITEKYPYLDSISIGPQIEHPHSPDEQVRISSVTPFWKFLCQTLQLLSQQK